MLDQKWSHEFWVKRKDLGYENYYQRGFGTFAQMLDWSSSNDVDFGWKEGSSYGQLFYHTTTNITVVNDITFDSRNTMLLPSSSCWDFDSNDFSSRMAFVKKSVFETHPAFKGTAALSEWNKCNTPILCGKVVPSSCNSVWAKNYFGIELSTYDEKEQMFITGSPIIAGGVEYYVDAIQHHDNCNYDVGLVYVANEKDCADGTPWEFTDECQFGGEITTPLETDDDWCLYSNGNLGTTTSSNMILLCLPFIGTLLYFLFD